MWANIGFFTVLLGLLVGPAGKVVSIEPGRDNIKRLLANIALNDLTNVMLIDQPLSNRPSEVTYFNNSDNSAGNCLWDPGDLGVTVDPLFTSH